MKLPMGRLEVPIGESADVEAVCARIRTVFGLANYSVAHRVAATVEAITEGVMRDLPRTRIVPSFRVEVRRAHKQFPVPSPDLERHIGAAIVAATGWKVDLSNPAFTVWVEIVPKAAYYHFGKEPGAGGLPTGTGGRVLVLLSGGIDSPVAAWRMMRRGCLATFVHFHGHPFTSHASHRQGARDRPSADALPARCAPDAHPVRRAAAAGDGERAGRRCGSWSTGA